MYMFLFSPQTPKPVVSAVAPEHHQILLQQPHKPAQTPTSITPSLTPAAIPTPAPAGEVKHEMAPVGGESTGVSGLPQILFLQIVELFFH